MRTDITPVLMTIKDFQHWSRLGRTKIYEEIGAKRLKALKVGSRTLIPMASAEAWLATHSEISAEPA